MSRPESKNNELLGNEILALWMAPLIHKTDLESVSSTQISYNPADLMMITVGDLE